MSDDHVQLQLSRRALLVNGGRGVAALSALGFAPSALARAVAAIDSTPTRADIANASGTVRALVWQGYDGKEIFGPLKKITLKPGYLTQNEDVLTKPRVGGGAQYDVLTIFQGYVDALTTIGNIVPIDTSLLTNYPKVFARFRNSNAFKRGGKQYSVPFLWGTMQVNYVADKVKRPRSFQDLMAPALKGKIGLNDDTYSAITQFARFAGAKNPNHLTKVEFDRTFKLLNQFKPQVAGIHAGPEVAGMLTRKEALVTTPDWTPSVITARKAGLNVQQTMPALTFVDGWLMVKGASNVAAAYAVIDQAISTQAQANAANAMGLGVTNRLAVPLLKKDLRDAWPYDHVNTLLAQAPAYPGVPVKAGKYASLADWTNAWEKYKASF